MNHMDSSTKNVGFDHVAEARIEAQNAAQWLARLTHSYAAPVGHDEEVQLHWDRAMQKIVTPEVGPGIALELALPTLTLQFLQDGKPSPHALDVDGKSATEVEAWLLVELLHRGFDRDNFSKRLPYKWAHLMSGDEVKHSPQDLVAELRQLTEWFDEATTVLAQAKDAVSVQDPQDDSNVSSKAPSELICWPERLDIGFLVPTFGTSTANVEIKVGFTVGDDKDIRPGYFVRGKSNTISLPVITLPLSQITRDAMSRTSVVDYLAAKVKDTRRSASN